MTVHSRRPRTWCSWICLFSLIAVSSRGATIGHFLGESEELVPGETYQYLPPVLPERILVYDSSSEPQQSRVLWRYPVPYSAVEGIKSPVKRAQFLRIG
uniref:Fibronectin type-III domain-containing protein n=1 Tax=Mesocestoides corti TaxID=53468 RepID=A0A5K3EMY9_MESCO